jgi:hypothetical protein
MKVHKIFLKKGSKTGGHLSDGRQVKKKEKKWIYSV